MEGTATACATPWPTPPGAQAMVYVFLHAFTWYTLWGTSWLFNPDNYWVADAPDGRSQLHMYAITQQQQQQQQQQHKCPLFTKCHPETTNRPAVERLYRVHTGFYMVSVLMLMLWETRRKDFPVMLAHHIVTLCLLIGSYAVRCDTFADRLVVLAVHSGPWLCC